MKFFEICVMVHHWWNLVKISLNLKPIVNGTQTSIPTQKIEFQIFRHSILSSITKKSSWKLLKLIQLTIIKWKHFNCIPILLSCEEYILYIVIISNIKNKITFPTLKYIWKMFKCFIGIQVFLIKCLESYWLI